MKDIEYTEEEFQEALELFNNHNPFGLKGGWIPNQEVVLYARWWKEVGEQAGKDFQNHLIWGSKNSMNEKRTQDSLYGYIYRAR